MIELKQMKTLDIQGSKPTVPSHLKSYFFDKVEKGNDIWIKYWVGHYSECEGKEIDGLLVMNEFDSWLLENTNVEPGEEILISHWW